MQSSRHLAKYQEISKKSKKELPSGSWAASDLLSSAKFCSAHLRDSDWQTRPKGVQKGAQDHHKKPKSSRAREVRFERARLRDSDWQKRPKGVKNSQGINDFCNFAANGRSELP